jgi:hypothetical protein
MDQIKDQWRKIQPHVFWIMCCGILLLSLASWYMSTKTLKEQQEANKSKIDGVFSTVNGLRTKAATHPNATTNQKMDEVLKSYGALTAAGWAQQYASQEDMLVWPASFDEDFKSKVRPLKPIEKVPVVTPFNLAIPDSFRRRYRDFIDFELPRLAETIGAEWRAQRDASQPDGNMASPMYRPDGSPVAPEVDKWIVLWNPANQQEILAQHYGFTMKEDDPSTLDVLYAQEDLWVLQNLMDIIKRTNEGATARHEATVKQIEFIRIGRSALGNAGVVMVPGMAAAGTTGAAGGPPSIMSEGAMPAGGEGGMPGEGGATTEGATSPMMDPNFNALDPANWRYVDNKNIPLAGFQLRDALTTPTEQNALLTVAKRMPVRLRFEIDQRRMARLLAELGNAKLPVEVRQLRINREAAAPGSVEGFFAAGQGTGGMPGGGGPGGGAMPGFGGEGGFGGGFGGGFASGGMGEGYGPTGGMPGGAGSMTRDATVDTNLIKIEIYGIVYLYNPVNRAVLGLEAAGATGDQPADPAATGEQPAAPATTPPAEAAPAAPTAAAPAAPVNAASGG